MVLGNKSPRLPVRAYILAVIRENIRLSSEILPVVSIDTLSLIVLFVEWTPLCFEVKHVKVGILFHLMNKPCFKLFGIVSEGTIVTILAFTKILRILGAVFRLILFWMINTFDSIVRRLAAVPIDTIFSLLMFA